MTLPRTRPSPRRGKAGTEAVFRVLLPRRVRTAPNHTKHESRFASAVDPFLRFLPSRVLLPLDLAPAFYRRASPRTLGRGDVPIRLGLRVFGIKRVGHPVSGVPTLVGFATLRICGAPSASLKGPDHRRSSRSSGPVLLPSHLDPIFSKATQPPKWLLPLSRPILFPSADALLHQHPARALPLTFGTRNRLSQSICSSCRLAPPLAGRLHFERHAAADPGPTARRHSPSVSDWFPRPFVSACLSKIVALKGQPAKSNGRTIAFHFQKKTSEPNSRPLTPRSRRFDEWTLVLFTMCGCLDWERNALGELWIVCAQTSELVAPHLLKWLGRVGTVLGNESAQ